VTAPDGGVATLGYDANGHLNAVNEPGSRHLGAAVDASGNLTLLTDIDATSRAFSYDGGHRLTNDQWSPLNATFSYDGATGRLTGVNRGLGSTYALLPRQLQGLATSPAASATFDVAVLTDPRNFPTTYALDSSGRLLQEWDPDGTSQAWARDPAGQVTAYADGLGHATLSSYAYGTGKGDLVETDDPDGGVWTYGYDPTFHKVTQVRDPLGALTTYAYSATDDRTRMTDAVGAVTTYAYYPAANAANGLLSSVTDPLTHVTQYAYDQSRRLTLTNDPLGSITLGAYDAAGNPLQVIDPLGLVTTTIYDVRNRLTFRQDGAGDATAYAYDAYGDLTVTADPRTYQATYAYDQRGWRTAMTEAAGTSVARTATTAYDGAGDATAVTDADGHTTTYSFDPVGRTQAVTVPLDAQTAAVTTYL
jgi:YD repeat-containing protein